jgi:hypothetical protein
MKKFKIDWGEYGEDGGYDPYAGSYAIVNIKGSTISSGEYGIEFVSCREEFAECFYEKTDAILMQLKNAKELKNVRTFMGRIQKQLKLSERSRLDIQPLEKILF